MKTLDALASDALDTVESGFYSSSEASRSPATASWSLVNAISKNRGRALICEVKFASPSAGDILAKGLPADIAKEMEAGGAVALSVLTEPKNFKGSISNLVSVRSATSLPIIMKDIVVSKEQIVAAKRFGANAVLLIEEIFTRKQTKDGLSLDEAVAVARNCGLDSIIETHTKIGLDIISNVDCDIIGLNNRDLNTFKTNIETTLGLLDGFTPKKSNNRTSPLIMSESGYENPEVIIKLKERIALNGSLQPDAFLIGTSIMKSDNVREKVQSFAKVLLS